MVSRTRLKSLLTGLALYTMAAAMVGYFGVNAYTGKYGLNARQELDQEIIALTSELARLKRERAEGEQRVSLLRSDRVDPDMLDERARFQLDYANPRDLVRIDQSELTSPSTESSRRDVASESHAEISKIPIPNRFRKCRAALQCGIAKSLAASRNPFMAV